MELFSQRQISKGKKRKKLLSWDHLWEVKQISTEKEALHAEIKTHSYKTISESRYRLLWEMGHKWGKIKYVTLTIHNTWEYLTLDLLRPTRESPSSSQVWMWELDHKDWAPKNWCFWTVVSEKTLESPLDCKEIQLVHPKGNQSWVFIGRTDAEVPILWPPDVKS